MSFKISIASDHAGYDVKKQIISKFTNHIFPLNKEAVEFIDCGCHSHESTDYHDYAEKAANNIYNKTSQYAILISGTVIEISIAANRFPFIRAVNPVTSVQVRLSREHNDANVICLGARISSFDEIAKMIEEFFSTEFLGMRHSERVEKLSRNILKNYIL